MTSDSPAAMTTKISSHCIVQYAPSTNGTPKSLDTIVRLASHCTRLTLSSVYHSVRTTAVNVMHTQNVG